MALTLVKEDGTGKTDANSYAGVADGDAYFEGHLYANAWTAATEATNGQHSFAVCWSRSIASSSRCASRRTLFRSS